MNAFHFVIPAVSFRMRVHLFSFWISWGSCPVGRSQVSKFGTMPVAIHSSMFLLHPWLSETRSTLSLVLVRNFIDVSCASMDTSCFLSTVGFILHGGPEGFGPIDKRVHSFLWQRYTLPNKNVCPNCKCRKLYLTGMLGAHRLTFR